MSRNYRHINEYEKEILEMRSQEKREGHRRAATPQWPRLPIHIHSILSPNTIIRHYTVNVKTWQSVWQCLGRKFLFNSQNRMYLPRKTSDLWGGSPPHRWVHPFLQQPTNTTKNKTDTTWKAMSVRCLNFKQQTDFVFQAESVLFLVEFFHCCKNGCIDLWGGEPPHRFAILLDRYILFSKLKRNFQP